MHKMRFARNWAVEDVGHWIFVIIVYSQVTHLLSLSISTFSLGSPIISLHCQAVQTFHHVIIKIEEIMYCRCKLQKDDEAGAWKISQIIQNEFIETGKMNLKPTY
jgi:hypothetical protein